MNIFVFGNTGQVGSSLCRLITESPSDEGVFLGHADADFREPEKLESFLDQLESEYSVDAIINAVAYNQVDIAEQDTDRARKTNTDAPTVLAKWCEARGKTFVTYSTDFVFPGTGERPWKEDDPVEPLNFYGKTKAEGEVEIQKVGGRFLILRTSWVYGATRSNFVTLMRKLFHEAEKVTVVNDQVGAPTYAPDLAGATLEILRKAAATESFPSGIYHLCHAGEVSRLEFAKEILEATKEEGPVKTTKLEPVLTKDYPALAQRPLNSRLDCSKTAQTFGVTLPDWKDGFQKCLEVLRKEA